MRKRSNQGKRWLYVLMGGLLMYFGIRPACAQFDDGFGGSFDPGIAASLYASDQDQGFNFSFDQATANFANPEIRTGISDPLHSYEIDSGISSRYDPVPLSTVVATPFTFALTTSDSTLGLNDTSRGEHSARFAAGVLNQLGRSGNLGPQGAQLMAGASQMRTAFTGGLSSSAAAFSDNPFRREASAEVSGPPTGAEAIAIPTAVAAGAQTPAGLVASVENSAPTSSLSSLSGVATADLQLGTPVSPPSIDAASFYGATVYAPQTVGSGDGEIPLNDETVGQQSVTPPRSLLYTSSGTGFTDSTKGNAALPSDALLSASPFTSPASATAVSPFPAVSEGQVFGVHESVSPNLHAMPLEVTPPSFQSFERHLKEQRIASGDPIVDPVIQSSADRLAYKRLYGGRQKAPHDTMPDVGVNAQAGTYGSSTPIR